MYQYKLNSLKSFLNLKELTFFIKFDILIK
jgi:hypothetical protein